MDIRIYDTQKTCKIYYLLRLQTWMSVCHDPLDWWIPVTINFLPESLFLFFKLSYFNAII